VVIVRLSWRKAAKSSGGKEWQRWERWHSLRCGVRKGRMEEWRRAAGR